MASLPFSQVAMVLDQDGVTVDVIDISPVWPVGGFNAQTGAAYDHQAEAELPAWEELASTNRVLRVGGRRYRVVQALKNDYLPHVALMLRYINPGGGGG